MSRVLRLRSGVELPTPLYLPVYQPKSSIVPMERWVPDYGIQALILNAFFLYKDREVRRRFSEGLRLKDHIGFPGVVMTDSGAFQGLSGPLYLKNKKIVAFQAAIGADIVSPLDLITPPWDSRSVADAKATATHKRIAEALKVAPDVVVAGVQQGGRFADLRRRSTDELVALGIEYLAIGSLVPFFNKDHAIDFVGQVISEARAQVGPEVSMHVYGAGDPVELPFMAALGADIFDSSAYGHYARDGWYMTPYGALKDLGPIQAGEWRCPCPACADGPAQGADLGAHNLFVVTRTVDETRAAVHEGRLDAVLADVLERHAAWFPDSALPRTWESLHG